VVNPRHPEAVRITPSAPIAVDWDRRFFGLSAP
jgi:hypothetical protein